MGISKRLLSRAAKGAFGDIEVSPLKSGACQVSVADGYALEAQNQTTDDMQVTLQSPHGPSVSWWLF